METFLKQESIEKLEKYANEIADKVNAEKEYMVARFLKETGLKVSECELCYHPMISGGWKIFVRKKQED